MCLLLRSELQSKKSWRLWEGQISPGRLGGWQLLRLPDSQLGFLHHAISMPEMLSFWGIPYNSRVQTASQPKCFSLNCRFNMVLMNIAFHYNILSQLGVFAKYSFSNFTHPVTTTNFSKHDFDMLKKICSQKNTPLKGNICWQSIIFQHFDFLSKVYFPCSPSVRFFLEPRGPNLPTSRKWVCPGPLPPRLAPWWKSYLDENSNQTPKLEEKLLTNFMDFTPKTKQQLRKTFLIFPLFSR